MVVTEFQYIFATYFYREEFTELENRHSADLVDKGLRRDAKGDKTGRTDSERVTTRTEVSDVCQGSDTDGVFAAICLQVGERG